MEAPDSGDEVELGGAPGCARRRGLLDAIGESLEAWERLGDRGGDVHGLRLLERRARLRDHDPNGGKEVIPAAGRGVGRARLRLLEPARGDETTAGERRNRLRQALQKLVADHERHDLRQEEERRGRRHDRRAEGRGEEGRGGEAREAAAEGDDEGRAQAELELAEGSQESRQERRRDEHARECGREPGRGEHAGSEDASEARCPEERRPQDRRDDPTDPARNEQSADRGPEWRL